MSSNRKSRIPFCDSLPSDWDEIPNRYIFYRHSRKVGDKSNCYQLLSLTTQGVKQKDINAAGGKVPKNYDNYQTVEKNDMIFCLFDLDCSAVFSGLSKYDGMITSAYNVFGVNNDYADNSYLNYWFQFVFSNRYYKMFSKSIRYTVTEDNFKMQYTPIPPIVEQVKIGEYLDGKIKKIDTLIANQQQQIEKLKQYKQSLITEVVNKGLDRNVAMKDSGIDWAVKIPKNWRIAKLKMICSMQSGNNITSNQINPNEGRYPVYGGNGFRGYYDKYNIEGERCIIGRQGALAGNVHYVTGQYWATDHAVVVTPKGEVTNEYLYYVLIAMNLNRYAYETAAQPGLAVSKVENLLVPFPAQINEQKKIVSFIKKRCYDIDELVNVKLSKIEKLNQYKKSLIYEYVTGKKRVPEA